MCSGRALGLSCHSTDCVGGSWPAEVGKQQETVSPRSLVTLFSTHAHSSRKGTVDATPVSVGRLVTAEAAASERTHCQKRLFTHLKPAVQVNRSALTSPSLIWM